ncbi:hypothetical protein [Demequina sp. SO4-18]|uniref:hypothetical protein n=1 Tax=Demequina sp. SO4-18 TaxID=3401026 RepID=UPI003B5AC909
MCQTLKIPLPAYGDAARGEYTAEKVITDAMRHLEAHSSPLQIADYILAHGTRGAVAELDKILERGKSAFTIGERAGRKALVRRVPLGVQVVSNGVMERSGRAGVRLAQAWEELYGLEPNPSEAYRLAILAVEDASVPVVSPKDASATLGKVLAQMESQGDWKLPLAREHDKAPTEALVIAQMRALWHGQHDRHGGQPSAPGNVTIDEARVAVALATALVAMFSDGLIARPQGVAG